jgi:outer membrane immunogenic protein
MKKIAFGLIAALSLIGTSAGTTAFAADMPVGPAWTAPVEPVRFTWTGFYIGGIAGAAISRPQVNLTVVDGPAPLYAGGDIGRLQNVGSTKSSDVTGAFGGRIGYNYQTGQYVWGLEGDFTSIRSKVTRFTTGNPFAGFGAGVANFNSTTQTDWVSTIRGRWGLAVDRVMLYATGGVAFGKVSFANSYVGFSPAGGGNEFENSSASKTQVGWTIGGGIDYCINNNWVLSFDYEHIDLGTLKASGLVTTGNPNTATMTFNTRLFTDIVSAGVAYKF